MTKDGRLRYSIEPENYQSLLLIQAFAIIDGQKSPTLSILVNHAIKNMIKKTIDEMKNDSNKYHKQLAELLSEQLKR